MPYLKNLIAGEWVDGDAGTIVSVSPSDTSDVVAECASASAKQVAEAAAAARQAFGLLIIVGQRVEREVVRLERQGSVERVHPCRQRRAVRGFAAASTGAPAPVANLPRRSRIASRARLNAR